jgi:hypothetical protein
MHRLFRILFAVVLSAVTLALCELAFRGFDRFTNPNENIDLWVKRTNQELREHPLLGYTYPPGQIRDDGQQIDEFGMPNPPEALQWNHVDIVGVGDSYVQAANKIFLEQFQHQNIRYHSLALFGYGPPNYNILMKEYGSKLSPDVYLYFTYLGNDPGDARRFESWQASGKSWYEFNGGYFMPIERQGYLWGWHLFSGRAKRVARNVVSGISADAYGAFKHVVSRDEAETVFEYVRQASILAQRQKTRLFVFVIPRQTAHKPFYDPIASKLLKLCAENGVSCRDLDPAFGDERTRAGLFAPDGHWNAAGMEIAWRYLWDKDLNSLMPSRKIEAAAVE